MFIALYVKKKRNGVDDAVFSLEYVRGSQRLQASGASGLRGAGAPPQVRACIAERQSYWVTREESIDPNQAAASGLTMPAAGRIDWHRRMQSPAVDGLGHSTR